MIKRLCPKLISLLGFRGRLKSQEEPVQLMPKGTTEGRTVRAFLVTSLPIPELASTLLLFFKLHFLRAVNEEGIRCRVALNRSSKC